MLSLFVLLVMAHFVCDYPLQNDYVAKFKCPSAGGTWYYVLLGHACTHGLAVYFLSGSLIVGLAETALHWIIDLLKCLGVYNIHVDQLLHVLCKLLWVMWLFRYFPGA